MQYHTCGRKLASTLGGGPSNVSLLRMIWTHDLNNLNDLNDLNNLDEFSDVQDEISSWSCVHQE
jgi:hypothetical protein